MKDEELDRILSSEDDLIPSSGFVSSVMEAVRQESVTPPPISFPWKHAMPGLAGLAVTLGWIVRGGMMQPGQPAVGQVPLPALFTTILETATRFDAGWVLLTLLLTWVLVKFSVRLAR